MIWTILTANPIARALAKIGGLILLVVTFGAWQRRQGAQAARAKQAEAALKATTKGAEAARKGRVEAADKLRKGKTPEQIVRENDDAWG